MFIGDGEGDSNSWRLFMLSRVVIYKSLVRLFLAKGLAIVGNSSNDWPLLLGRVGIKEEFKIFKRRLDLTIKSVSNDFIHFVGPHFNLAV